MKLQIQKYISTYLRNHSSLLCSIIGNLGNEAIFALDNVNASLKGVLPKDYARPALNAGMLGELIDLILGVAIGSSKNQARVVLGRAYEYFLGQFAGSEGKRGGEFHAP